MTGHEDGDVGGGDGTDGDANAGVDPDAPRVTLSEAAVADLPVDGPSWPVPGTERVVDGWPVELTGVTESVVATLGPNGLWNVAALGLHAPDLRDEGDGRRDAAGDGGGDGDGDRPNAAGDGGSVTATTWGRTRTWRNLTERGSGVVQFVSDPRTFVDAALTVREESAPVVGTADAWVHVDARSLGVDRDGGTRRERWALDPVVGGVRRERPYTISRAFGAVVDATVAASRLDVDAYDEAVLLDRLAYFADTVNRCGGPAAREAMARVDAATGWRDRLD